MPDKLLTPARCDELFATPEGKRVLDAAAAVAMGWEQPIPHRLVFWRDGESKCGAPPYASSAPDAPDYDKLCGEMLRALRREFANAPVIITFWPSGTVAVAVGSARFAGEVKGESLSVALVKALAAAGKLKEPENAK